MKVPIYAIMRLTMQQNIVPLASILIKNLPAFGNTQFNLHVQMIYTSPQVWRQTESRIHTTPTFSI
jgi:hypothetical protein